MVTKCWFGIHLIFRRNRILDCSILPVELTQFEAEYYPEENTVDIHWITETERNSDHFVVQKSADGVNFEDIGKVSGMGNSQYETQYYLPDENPFIGINYYRLKSVDNNGEYEYSEIRSVNILEDHYDILSVNPNPTTDISEVVFNSYVNGEAEINVYNSQGAKINSAIFNCKKGGNRFNVDLSDQTNGIYFVQINTAHKTFTTKIQKK